ncbi:Cysteine desulfurase [Melia azedarach]|uniref:Cysteine desulfurase n=1 Tax=Melia azedarach TaxID=155640 RepID=A0ACC1XVZ1_MELAZ|nr:Cysteine desulfurase [Melia azedarach]
MKLKQLMLIRDDGKSRSRSRSSSAKACACSGFSDHNLHHFSESFRALDMKDSVPGSSSSPEKKLSWLQSQMIGNSSEFDSPFGKRRLTYADHTASGRSLHYIEDYIINNVLPFYGNTHTCDSYVGKQTTQMVHEACRYIQKCLGGGEEDALIFCGSGSTAAIKRLQEVMGIAVPSILRQRVIKCLRDEERWVVFVGPHEHHSNLLSWRQSLAEVVEIGLDDDGLLNIESLRLQLELYKDANRPILGSFSACSNVTGIYSDTRAIARLLHQYGGFACFDFAASAPYVEIEMRSGEMDGYDAIFLSPHKFLGGPGSPGVLLMNKALYQLGSSPPSTCGGGTVDYVNGFNEKDTLYLEDIEERENGGTPQIVQMIRAALAFWVKQYIGYEVIKKQEEIYIERAMKRLLPNENIKVLGNTSASRLAILSFLVYSTTNSSLEIERDKPLHGAFVATLLNDLFGIQARGGCACAGPYGHNLLDFDKTQSHKIRSAVQKGYKGVKPGWTRVSFPYYMSDEEFEFILEALEFIAAYGQRFLPLYHFNLKTGNWCYKQAIKDLIGKENNAGILQETNIHKNAAIKHNPKIENFASYLENAKQIADILHKFPIQRSLPEDLDTDILHFRI